MRLGDDPERRERVAGVDGRRGAVAYRRGDARVEAGVVASLGGHAQRAARPEPSMPSVPHASSGVSPKSASAGEAPATSAGSCPSRP